MTINYVDMGYYAAPYMSLDGVTMDETACDNYMIDLHDRIVATGNMSDTNVWGVSKVGKWTGSPTHLCYGIRIEHRVAGVPSGRIWMLIIGGLDLAGGAPDLVAATNAMQGTTQYDTYFTDVLSPSSQAATDGFIALHHFDNYPTVGAVAGVTDYAWGVVNHLDAPSVNPDVDLAGFMPNTNLKGLSIGNLDRTSDRYNWHLLFDPTAEWVGFSVWPNSTRNDCPFGFCGKVFVNSYSADTSESGSFGGSYAANGSLANYEVWGLDAGGAAADFTLEVPTFLNYTNEFLANGDAVLSAARVYTSTYVKGELDRRVFPIALASTTCNGKPVTITGGLALKLGTGPCIPWPENVALPTGGWPANPQSIPT